MTKIVTAGPLRFLIGTILIFSLVILGEIAECYNIERIALYSMAVYSVVGCLCLIIILATNRQISIVSAIFIFVCICCSLKLTEASFNGSFHNRELIIEHCLGPIADKLTYTQKQTLASKAEDTFLRNVNYAVAIGCVSNKRVYAIMTKPLTEVESMRDMSDALRTNVALTAIVYCKRQKGGN